MSCNYENKKPSFGIDAVRRPGFRIDLQPGKSYRIRYKEGGGNEQRRKEDPLRDKTISAVILCQQRRKRLPESLGFVYVHKVTETFLKFPFFFWRCVGIRKDRTKILSMEGHSVRGTKIELLKGAFFGRKRSRSLKLLEKHSVYRPVDQVAKY